jgi:drug/metabolite transporter (DMT)-like permease
LARNKVRARIEWLSSSKDCSSLESHSPRPVNSYCGKLGEVLRSLRNIGIFIIIIGAVITSGMMISTTSAVSSFSDFLVTLGFYVWVMLPFIILIALTLYIHRKGLSYASRMTILLTSILVVVSSVLIYWTAIFNSESSTSALVFIFIPIYALVTIAVVYAVAWLLIKSFVRR